MRSQNVASQEHPFQTANEKPVYGILSKRLSSSQWETNMWNLKNAPFPTATKKSARGTSTAIEKPARYILIHNSQILWEANIPWK